MAATSTLPAPLPHAVVAWRYRHLQAAGFAPAAARRLARDRGDDLHALIEIIERGCPPALAVRILAPLPTGGRRC